MMNLSKIKKLIFFPLVLIALIYEPIESKTKVLRIGAIPDQNQEILDRRFSLLSKELSREMNIEVKYIPVVNYIAAVSGFRTKSLDLVWFGGLSGVQARLQTPGSIVLAQRDIDKEFKSVFIVNKKQKLKQISKIEDLKKLKDLRFTFGSENSTSGRLMPQYFLNKAGLKLTDFKSRRVGFSGSHDATIALVNSGSYDAGVLNKQIWDRTLTHSKVMTKNVSEFFVTPPYVDYHWVSQGDLDKKFNKGFTKRLKHTILNFKKSNPEQKIILDMFRAKKFIEADVEQYNQIESIARKLKKIR